MQSVVFCWLCSVGQNLDDVISWYVFSRIGWLDNGYHTNEMTSNSWHATSWCWEWKTRSAGGDIDLIPWVGCCNTRLLKAVGCMYGLGDLSQQAFMSFATLAFDHIPSGLDGKGLQLPSVLELSWVGLGTSPWCSSACTLFTCHLPVGRVTGPWEKRRVACSRRKASRVRVGCPAICRVKPGIPNPRGGTWGPYSICWTGTGSCIILVPIPVTNHVKGKVLSMLRLEYQSEEIQQCKGNGDPSPVLAEWIFCTAADVFSAGLDEGSQVKVTDLNWCVFRDHLIFDVAVCRVILNNPTDDLICAVTVVSSQTLLCHFDVTRQDCRAPDDNKCALTPDSLHQGAI